MEFALFKSQACRWSADQGGSFQVHRHLFRSAVEGGRLDGQPLRGAGCMVSR